MKSVVIVDDHAAFRRQARRMLVSAGYDVVGEAVDGRSAIAEVRRLNPSLVLMDVGLPDMTGFQVAELIDPSRVVLTSARDPRSFATRLAASRALGFLPKDELSAAAIEKLARAG
jgi:DNA-binding NarL/FixJ family response regulator